MNIRNIEVVWGRLCLALLFTVLVLGGLEWASRRHPLGRSAFEQQFPVQDFRHPKPYVMFSGRPGGEGLNAYGYRGPYPQLPKPAGELRILFLGGSTVLEGEPTICELVESGLRQAACTNARTYNLGVVSSISGMELVKLVLEAADLQPDIIVDYNGGNDIFHPLVWDPRPGYPFNFLAYENNPCLESDVRAYPTLALLAYGSNLLRYFFPGYFVKAFVPLDALRREAGYGSTNWQQRIAANYVLNMVKLAKVAGTMDAECLVFLNPMVFFKAHLAPEERPMCTPSAQAHVLAVRELIRREVALARSTTPLDFTDLSGIYDNTAAPCYVDFIHTRQDAKQAVAQAICARLLPLADQRLKRKACPPRALGSSATPQPQP